MRRIAITQRVEVSSPHGERRDALDQRWVEFIQSIGMWCILVPNNPKYVQRMIEKECIDGVLLTGGNSLVRYGGKAPERDEIERMLLKWAYTSDVPVLGVCRGMQMIQDYFNNDLIEVSGHVAKRHSLFVENDTKLGEFVGQYQDVNSYHNYGALKVDGDLLQVARSEDGVVMAVEHRTKNIFGVMWHSEREQLFQKEDKKLFDSIFIGIK